MLEPRSQPGRPGPVRRPGREGRPGDGGITEGLDRSASLFVVIHERLDRIIRLLERLVEQGERMANELQDLTDAVAAEDTVIDSAIVLIEGFAAQLAAAGTDPAKLAALSADITAKTAALAAAVAANTPAAPAPTPAPDPTPAP
jgi:hypothetical protein